MTLHTSTGCTLDTALASQFTGKHTASTNCKSGGDNNDGCGITDFSPHVYGHAFNMLGPLKAV
jgi:hypothetical protein